jgi:sterol 3beta-glucosyltransferase
MKIILVSVGTRGDMEPFLAIGEILKEKGVDVICAFPERFRNLTEDSNLKFASLGKKLNELLESEVGKAAMGGSGSRVKKFIAYIKLAVNQKESSIELLNKQYELIERENPDRIVHNGKAIYPIIWGLKNRGKNILVCPFPYMHFVKDHAHIAFNRNLGTYLNKLTYALADFGLITTVMISKKWLDLKEKITRGEIRCVLKNNKGIYTISPSLFPRPDYWKENLKILGYHEKSRTAKGQADKDVNEFLEKQNKALLITFGSMSNPDPEEKTKLIVDILERNKIPAIINTASGGLVKVDRYDQDLIHFVDQIPYEFILPKIYGVIHHGGSGTTHMGLKYGCATMILPHIIDQFVWSKIIYRLGAGPKGIKVGKVTRKNLEPKIIELISNRSYKERAEQIASRMNKENFREELYKTIIEE